MRADSAIMFPGYQDALRWLYGLSPNIRTAAEIVADHPRKLARVRALLDLLGAPDRQLASVLIAGTKGKGSIAACTEAILRAAGYRTGLVTSPHLTSWCERTRVGGCDVEPGTVVRLLPMVRSTVERLDDERPDLGQVTTFEAGFAFALMAFVERGVQVAIVEAGVGGLHDATNVLDPVAVALGPVSYDHTGTLGQTLAAIATEKVGVFRGGRVAVSGLQVPEVLSVVEPAAGEQQARLELLGEAWHWRPDDDDPGRGRFTIQGPRGQFAGLTLPLLGRHQRENAAVAVALASAVFESLGWPGGAGEPSAHAGAATPQPDRTSPSAAVATIPRAADAAVRAGLASLRWPGRLQVLGERPWLVVDGAHNGDSAARLAEAIGDCFPDGRLQLIFGTSVGKDVTRMLDALLPISAAVTLTRSHHERSVPLDSLGKALAARGVAATIVPEVRDAVGQAVRRAAPADLILVTGSLFVVGEVLEAYGERQEMRT